MGRSRSCWILKRAFSCLLLIAYCCICYLHRIHRLFHIVHADDVRALEDGDYGSRDGGGDALLDRGIDFIARDGPAEEGLARRAAGQREAECVELVESRQQRAVLFIALAEAEAGVEHDASAHDAG